MNRLRSIDSLATENSLELITLLGIEFRCAALGLLMLIRRVF